MKQRGPTTQTTYAAALKQLRLVFGGRRLTDITASDVARQQQASLKASSVRAHLACLGSAFNYAARHLGYAGTNPVALLDRVERPHLDDQKKKRILTEKELRRLIDAMDPHYRPTFELAAETGGTAGSRRLPGSWSCRCFSVCRSSSSPPCRWSSFHPSSVGGTPPAERGG